MQAMNRYVRAAGTFVTSGVAALIALVSLTTTSWAQTDTELTESQLDYNNKGVMLINEGKYDEALGYFQSSLAIGEANVTYLNLGRTYARMERCAEAAAAFERVESAPQVKSPPPAAIDKILKRYRAELFEVCSARIRLRCPDEKVSVAIGDAPAVMCPQLPVPVTPGEHRVQVTFEGRESVQTVDAKAGEVTQLDVEVPQDPANQEPADEKPVAQKPVEQAPTALKPITPPEREPSNGLRTAAWVSSITGGALLATGLVVDQTVVGSRLDEVEAASTAGDRSAYDTRLEEYEQARDLNRAVFIAGGALAASGVVMWILSADESGEPTGGASVVPRDGGASLEVNWRW
jgi:tetratricopeptide (TPR) repeat protein